ncbi:MAG: hypothetical protein KF819_01560 [Labilithrix sp.]|nr:hypothetical protein [Labilithrix sp.]
MTDERVKQAMLTAIADAKSIATSLEHAMAAARSESALPPPPASLPPAAPPTKGTQRLLTRIVLVDILDDGILGARPSDRAFPLRLFFSELGTLLASDSEEGPIAQAADLAFTLASGLNFFLRATMDGEAKVRVGLEVSRHLYALAALPAAKLDPEMIAKAAPLLASIMSADLERVRFESVDHAKVFDSQVHERAEGSDASASRITRPASFLARVTTNNAVKAKAQVVT